MSDVTEKEIEKYLVDLVEDNGGLCLKLELNGQRGFPDRTVLWPATDSWPGFRPARTDFIEVKKSGGKISKQQDKWLEKLHSVNHTAVVLSSKKEVDEYISRR